MYIMAELDLVARKWGDSLAIIIPKEVIKRERIRQNEKLHVIVQKELDLSDLFGKWKTQKTAQQLKDASREAWD